MVYTEFYTSAIVNITLWQKMSILELGRKCVI